jgi:DNA (cytosine-5)-methyltransferase 1
MAPERPKTVLVLGKPEMLRWEMSQAAAYFGIEVPIGRRDRKSGARKRKQHEINLPQLQVEMFAY